jgi:hypothetical protein
MPKSFRTHLGHWMDSIGMPRTNLRDVFILRYKVLLDLRGVCPHLLGPRRAAMGVLLNLDRHPAKQANYLRAVIRQINRLIADHIDTMVIGDGTLWDVPGHIAGSLPGYRFAVIEDPPGANVNDEPAPPLIVSDDE